MFLSKLIFGVFQLSLSQSDGWTLKMSLTGRIYLDTKVCSTHTHTENKGNTAQERRAICLALGPLGATKNTKSSIATGEGAIAL